MAVDGSLILKGSSRKTSRLWGRGMDWYDSE